MKKILFAAIALLLCAWLPAQDLKRITIKGIVSDTANADMPFATVMLLNPVDSNLINFTRADDKGAFQFKNIKNSAYLLKVSYVGYIPLQMHLPASTTEVNDLGTVRMKQINTQLNEVVIKAARSTLSFKGDTIEYDAASFKVPPGSTVEDLLRRLPGIDVDADGNLKAQGKDVQRLYVDGKTFFSNDPKAATKNLGAETISKVQVYDEKSQQTQLTGVDDGKETKVMNLELKEEYKKGSFGKITGAVGTEERWAARGNYNRFNSKEQFSVIGYGNNINQSGINWDDYGEFRGQNTWNNRDEVDFGFSSGSFSQSFNLDDRDIPISFNDGRGFSENYGAGANYNYDHKKTKANVSYFYNQTQLDLDQFGFRQNFTPSGTFSNTDTLAKSDLKGNHSLTGRWEQQIDSSNTLIISAKARLSTNEAQDIQSQLFSESQRFLQILNTNELQNRSLSGTAIFRHKFRKKGRSFSLSSAYNLNDNESDALFTNRNRNLAMLSETNQVRQNNNLTGNAQQIRASTLFTEPIGKKWYWETFYNFAQATNVDNRQVTNPDNENIRIDSLSLWFDNTIGYNRLGSSLRYAHDGLNVSAGLAGQRIHIGSAYAVDEGLPLSAAPFSRNFVNLVPFIDFSKEFENNRWLNAQYLYSVQEPQINDLRPVPNVSNPLFRSEGNPALRPTRTHEASVDYGFWNASSLNNLGVNVNLEVYEDKIAQSQIIEVIDTLGVRTTTRPENVSGAYALNSYIWYGFPIIKTKLTMNLNGNGSFNSTPAFINGNRNITETFNYNLRPGLNYTPSTKLIVGASFSAGGTNINYSIQPEQNQIILNYSGDLSVKWEMFAKTFFEGNYKYARFENRTTGFERTVPLVNASVRRLLGKSNRVEVRLAAFDLLNRRVTVTQYGSQNFVYNSVANTLARYFMVSVSYNVRGYESKLKKNDWW